MNFLFLSRAGFNGMMRFNRSGEWNIPFCKKSERFAPAYVTKIVNQIDCVSKAMKNSRWEFVRADFREIINRATKTDLIYCDPPYLGRHVDYFDSWREDDERDLAALLAKTKARFVISTWHSNEYRHNASLEKYWNGFTTMTREHFYHVGAKEENRNPMLEALVMNFDPELAESESGVAQETEQMVLLERPVAYRATSLKTSAIQIRSRSALK